MKIQIRIYMIKRKVGSALSSSLHPYLKSESKTSIFLHLTFWNLKTKRKKKRFSRLRNCKGLKKTREQSFAFDCFTNPISVFRKSMASGSSGRVNSGSKGFDFGSDDILCSYDDYTNQDSSNGPNSDPAIAATNSNMVNTDFASLFF